MRRFAIAVLAALVTLGVLSSPAAAVEGTTTLSVVNGMVGGFEFELHVDGEQITGTIANGALVEDVVLASGRRKISLIATNVVGGRASIFEDDLYLVPGADMSFVASFGALGGSHFVLFSNTVGSVSAGNGRLTVRHLAAAGFAGVVLDDAAPESMIHGQSVSTDVAAGTHRVSVPSYAGTWLAPATGIFDITVAAGSHQILYLVGDPASNTSFIATEVIESVNETPDQIRVVHGLASPNVDTYVDGALVDEDLAPGGVGEQLLVRATATDVELFSADAPYAIGTGLLRSSSTPRPSDGQLAYVAYGDTSGAQAIPAPAPGEPEPAAVAAVPVLGLFVDDTSATIPDERGRVVVRHVADAPEVDVLAGAFPVGRGVVNGAESRTDLPVGSYAITLADPSDGTVLADLGSVDVRRGTRTTIYVRGAAADGTLAMTTQNTAGFGQSGAFPDAGGAFEPEDVRTMLLLGITRGSSGLFEPGRPITRGEVAAFLSRGLSLPPSTVDVFTDDDGSLFAADINALRAAGITEGTSPTTFSPDVFVTRGEMAAFLARAFSVPASATDAFTDDTDSIFEADINAIAAAGITRGAGADRFVPTDIVTRAQMASFLARAFGLGAP